MLIRPHIVPGLEFHEPHEGVRGSMAGLGLKSLEPSTSASLQFSSFTLCRKLCSSAPSSAFFFCGRRIRFPPRALLRSPLLGREPRFFLSLIFRLLPQQRRRLRVLLLAATSLACCASRTACRRVYSTTPHPAASSTTTPAANAGHDLSIPMPGWTLRRSIEQHRARRRHGLWAVSRANPQASIDPRQKSRTIASRS